MPGRCHVCTSFRFRRRDRCSSRLPTAAVASDRRIQDDRRCIDLTSGRTVCRSVGRSVGLYRSAPSTDFNFESVMNLFSLRTTLAAYFRNRTPGEPHRQEKTSTKYPSSDCGKTQPDSTVAPARGVDRVVRGRIGRKSRGDLPRRGLGSLVVASVR